ncbi:putative RNA-directed DNA polymerase [Helianthus annuus]|nr:putative RNA-directed DNA polymerase [Helianthus annuus]
MMNAMGKQLSIFLYGIIPLKILPNPNPILNRCPLPPVFFILPSHSFSSPPLLPVPMESKLHPAMTISNIRNFIPLVLEKESPHYPTWLELFQIHCRAYEVIEHLSPKPAEPASSSAAGKTEADPKAASWSRLDAFVLQWIYGTISNDLLHIICVPGQSAYQAWTALQNEFNDNSNTRAIFLGQEFAYLNLANFSSMSAYLPHAKLLADQLQGLGSSIDNCMLVLQVLTGLTEQFDGISTVLQNRDPLPDFSEVRSRLTNEEAKKKRQSAAAAQHSATALAAVAASQQPSDVPANNRNRSRGRGKGRPRGYNNNRSRQPPASPNHPYIVFPSSWTANQ